MIKSPPSELPGIAAIDIGTNSIHLVIAKTDHYGHMVHTDSDKEVVRLGEAIDDQGNFTESAIEKAADIIAHMKETGEWGEFFPATLSPHGYNETVAQDYFPLSKQDVEKRGWYWRE